MSCLWETSSHLTANTVTASPVHISATWGNIKTLQWASWLENGNSRIWFYSIVYCVFKCFFYQQQFKDQIFVANGETADLITNWHLFILSCCSYSLITHPIEPLLIHVLTYNFSCFVISTYKIIISVYLIKLFEACLQTKFSFMSVLLYCYTSVEIFNHFSLWVILQLPVKIRI